MTLREELRTARLMVARADLGRVEQLVGAIDASHPELDRWMGWSAEATLETTTEFLRRANQEWDEGRLYQFDIMLEGAPVGGIGLNGVNPMLSSAEIGYWIRSDLAGRGLMTEAAAAIVDFAFADAGLHRLELHAGLENRGSIRVAEKLGFQKEGVLREAGRGAGGWYDVIVFGLLDSDPRP